MKFLRLGFFWPEKLMGRGFTMTVVDEKIAFTWRCVHTWRQAAINTWWCLLGCSIGDLGTIGFFQWSGIEWPGDGHYVTCHR
ncbi:MAG: hypothetical protein Ct9H300mP13_5660 [Gammaproteobacteria bacterium]|nr:MAG: hypothetical protein Ct9H300mP13_5660 [Gammaproteobacteria bacterium]